MLNVLVPEVVLHSERILPVAGELLPTRMVQHMRIHRKWKLRRHRRQALGEVDVPRFRLLALEPAQRTYLGAAHRMHARRSVLHASHVQVPVFEVNLIPPERTQLRRPESMAVSNKDFSHSIMHTGAKLWFGVIGVSRTRQPNAVFEFCLKRVDEARKFVHTRAAVLESMLLAQVPQNF